MAGICSKRPVACSVLVALLGCAQMWEGVRERERQSSVGRARELVASGRCTDALSSIERAQALRDLGTFEAESVWMKALCLEQLERVEEALAHWRFLLDFHPTSEFAAHNDEALRARLSLTRYVASPAPPELVIPLPRYTDSAGRSWILGRVLVEYSLGVERDIESIHVMDRTHPLLASWAIEAIANAKFEDGMAARVPARYRSSFRFRSRFHEDPTQAAPE